ncbi:MAG: hypothetical protein ABI591_28995 [Kofleriaceae bacterium]
MDDFATTMQLAATMNLPTPGPELASLFELAPELVEWSINSVSDPRGTLRVSAWTRDRWRAARALELLAPERTSIRETLVDSEEYEGVGLALRSGEPPSVRWWSFASEGHDMAERARVAWPAHAPMMDELFATVGATHACTAVGLESSGDHQRETIYARLGDAAAAIRVLELAQVPVSRASNLFWKGLCGLEPNGRTWPKVWVGRSLGAHSGWKFYYFARGDELRRTDEVLLAAVEAGPELRASWQALRGVVQDQPCIQLIGLTIPDGLAPAFTVYLGRI